MRIDLLTNSVGLLVGSWLFLHRTPSMFGKFLVHAQRWCGGLHKEHSILVQLGSNSFGHAKRY